MKGAAQQITTNYLPEYTFISSLGGNRIFIIRKDDKNFVLKLFKETSNITRRMSINNIGLPLVKSGVNNDNIYYLLIPYADCIFHIDNKKGVQELIDKMHKLDIIHGDLYLSNIVKYNNRLYFIDFEY
jgi:tRNA A-37 threonylcarbamoyl transferase component Bud32